MRYRGLMLLACPPVIGVAAGLLTASYASSRARRLALGFGVAVPVTIVTLLVVAISWVGHCSS